MATPFRFGVTASAIYDPVEFIEHCKKAEDLGYSAISMADHLDNQLAPLIGLAAAAQATSTIKLTTLVLANDYRHPAVLAKEATSIDQLSSGRLELGIGAGWMRTDYEQTGIDYDRPGIRISRLVEAVNILKAAFEGNPVNFSGQHYTLTDYTNTPAPYRSGGIPLIIAGGGKKVLTLAGQEADIIGVNPGLAAGVIDDRAGATATLDATDEKIKWIKEAAGQRFNEIELQTRVHMAAITDDRQALADCLAPALGLTGDQALASPHVLVGSHRQCVETLHEWRERWDISYIGLSHSAMEEMAPLVAELTGS